MSVGVYLRNAAGFFLEIFPCVMLVFLPFSEESFRFHRKRVLLGEAAAVTVLSALFPAAMYAAAQRDMAVAANIFMGAVILLTLIAQGWLIREAPIKKTMAVFAVVFYGVTQYGPDCEAVKFDSFSKLLDDFYTGRDAAERRRQRARELTKTVRTAAERTERRLEAQRRELQETENRDWLRQCGDIITANLYSMKKGQRELTAEDFYLGGERRIPLDPLKTPQQNAAKYYKDYNRAKSARAHLTERVEAGEGELEYLKSVLEELERAQARPSPWPTS